MVLLCNEFPVNVDRDARSSKLRVLDESISIVLALLTLGSACGFPAPVSERHRNRHPTIVSYYYDISGDKESFGVKHYGTEFPCIMCLIRKDSISNLTKGKRGLKAGKEVSCCSHNELFGAVDALYKKKMLDNNCDKRALSYLALD